MVVQRWKWVWVCMAANTTSIAGGPSAIWKDNKSFISRFVNRIHKRAVQPALLLKRSEIITHRNAWLIGKQQLGVFTCRAQYIKLLDSAVRQRERNLFHSLDSDHYHRTNKYFYFGLILIHCTKNCHNISDLLNHTSCQLLYKLNIWEVFSATSHMTKIQLNVS